MKERKKEGKKERKKQTSKQTKVVNYSERRKRINMKERVEEFEK